MTTYVYSQVTITAQHVEKPGAELTYKRMDLQQYYSPGSDGTNQYWNFYFNGTNSQKDKYLIVSPSQIPNLSQFPTSNLALYTKYITYVGNGTEVHDLYTLFRLAGNGLYLLGAKYDSLVFRYDDPLLYYSFPLHYGVQFSDSSKTISKSPVNNNAIYDSTMSINIIYYNAQVVGDGNITIHGKAYPYVVKIKYNYSIKTEVWIHHLTNGWILQGVRDGGNYVEYRWVSKDIGFPVLELRYNADETTTKSVSFLYDYKASPANIYGKDEFKFSVYPNPVHDLLYVDFPRYVNANYKVYNVCGKIVFESQSFGEKLNKLDLFNLQKSIYILEISVAGKSYYHKFVKN